jgi:hypothetical protein
VYLSVSEASFFKTRVGANFTSRRQLECRRHCWVGANFSIGANLTLKNWPLGVNGFKVLHCLQFLFQLATLTNTQLDFKPSGLLTNKEVNVYFLYSSDTFDEQDMNTVKVICSSKRKYHLCNFLAFWLTWMVNQKIVALNALHSSWHHSRLRDSRPGFESRQGMRFLGKT